MCSSSLFCDSNSWQKLDLTPVLLSSGFVWLIPHQEKVSECCSGRRTEIHLCRSSGGYIDVSDRAVEQKWPSFVSVADLMTARVHWAKHRHTPSTGEQTLFKLLLNVDQAGLYYIHCVPGLWICVKISVDTDFYKLCSMLPIVCTRNTSFRSRGQTFTDGAFINIDLLCTFKGKIKCTF